MWRGVLFRIVAPLVLLALVFGAVTVRYRSDALLMHLMLFNSDGMYLPTLFSDLFRHGGHIRDWYLTPAPYFFPDFLFFGLAQLLSKGAFDQHLVSGLLQLAAATAAIAWIVRSCVREHAVAIAVLVTAAASWLAMHGVAPYFFVLTSGFHFGACLAALVFVALWLQHDQHPRRWQLACMCALTFATTLSDSLFAVQTIAPFLVTCALVRQPQRATGWRAIVPHAAILAAALAGIAAYKWVVRHPTRPPSVPGLSHLAANAHDLRDVLAELVSQPPLLGVVLGAWLVVSVAGLVRIVHTGGFARLPRPLLQLLVFALVAAAGNLAAMLLLTYLVVNPRYLIAVALWPLIVVAMLLAHAAPRWCGAASLVLTCVLLLLLGSDAVTAARRPNTEPVAYPATIACIDRALATSGAHHGIAGYWDAKRVQALSRHDLAIAQYLSDLTQHPWITTARYFRPTYDFALINAANGPEYLLPMAQLIAHNGPPAHMAVCDRITVLVYLQDKLAIPAPR